VDNIERVLSRGERIELLVDKTGAMSGQARAFRKRSQTLRRRMWWRNTKLIALTVFVVVVRSLPMENGGTVLMPSLTATCLPARGFCLRCQSAALQIVISYSFPLASPFFFVVECSLVQLIPRLASLIVQLSNVLTSVVLPLLGIPSVT
jgi:hypothetical protein